MFKLIFSICCFYLLSINVSANWLDNINQTFNRVQGALSSQHTASADISRAPKNKPAILANGKNLPSHWLEHITLEPIFNSELYFIQSGRQNRQTVILIHGLGQSGFLDWQHVIPALEKDYHIIALDLPGFGRSATPPGRYSPTIYARVIDWLANNYAKSSPIIIGHSMGGAVALRYAAEHPNKLKHLVLVDAAGILERAAFIKHSVNLPINLQQIPASLTHTAVKTQDFTNALTELSTVIPDVTTLISRNNFAWNRTFYGRPNFNAAVALVNERFSRAVKTLPVNTSIIWGEDDNIAPLRTGKVLVQQLKSARLATIPFAKHVPMLTHAEAFNALLLAELTTPMQLKRPKKHQHINSVETKDLICNQESGTSYTGAFNKIIINNCTGIKLDNIFAKQATITDSVVEFNHVYLETTNTALYIDHSSLMATNSSIKGILGIHAEDSRLDLAGVKITGKKRGISVGKKSRFIFSLSELLSPSYRGELHAAYNSEFITLDALIRGESNL